MALDDWYYTAGEVFDLIATHGLLGAVAILAPEGISPDYPALRQSWTTVRTRLGEALEPQTEYLEIELLRIKQKSGLRAA